jgi:hypothetical protein
MQLRNSMVVLSKISGNFPLFDKIGNNLQSAAKELELIEERGDVKQMARSLFANLNLKKKAWESEFSKDDESAIPDVTMDQNEVTETVELEDGEAFESDNADRMTVVEMHDDMDNQSQPPFESIDEDLIGIEEENFDPAVSEQRSTHQNDHSVSGEMEEGEAIDFEMPNSPQLSEISNIQDISKQAVPSDEVNPIPPIIPMDEGPLKEENEPLAPSLTQLDSSTEPVQADNPNVESEKLDQIEKFKKQELVRLYQEKKAAIGQDLKDATGGSEFKSEKSVQDIPSVSQKDDSHRKDQSYENRNSRNSREENRNYHPYRMNRGDQKRYLREERPRDRGYDSRDRGDTRDSRNSRENWGNRDRDNRDMRDGHRGNRNSGDNRDIRRDTRDSRDRARDTTSRRSNDRPNQRR